MSSSENEHRDRSVNISAIKEIDLNDRTIDGKQMVAIETVNPKPTIGLIGAVTFGLGSMIGSGIFISPKGALLNAGSLGMSMVMWTLAGVISLIIGLVYCELAARVPQSGGDFSYIYKGLGQVPAFLPIWTKPLFTNTAGTAVLALVFADYLLALLYGTCTPPGEIRKLIAAVHVLALGISNAASVKLGVYVQVVSSFIKTIALVVIAIGGIVFLAQGRTENFTSSFEGSSTDVTSYCLSLYSCMFAYGGYNQIGEIAEEIQHPKKNIPRAIVISVVLVMTIYLLANISYFALLSKPDFISSQAVAYDWALKAMPAVAVCIPLAVMCSVYGANNGYAFTTSRIMFAAARRDMYPEIMSYLHVDSALPVIPVIVYHAITLLMLIPGDIGKLINFLSFMGFLSMLLGSVSLIRLKWQDRFADKADSSHVTVPSIVPAFGVLVSLFLIVAPFVTTPRIEFVYAVAFVIGGYMLYVPFVHFKLKLPGMDKLTLFLQLACNICPTEKVE